MISILYIYIPYFSLLLFIPQQKGLYHIYLIGDSTMSTYPESYYPLLGWGQVFESFFQQNVKVHNMAISGRSTKSYIEDGNWQKVLNKLDKGDYLLIQFGHNDMVKEKEHLYTAPFGAYTNNLKIFIEEARNKKAIPVLITPVCRRRFDDDGNFHASLGKYPIAMRVLAEEEQVALIDLHKQSFQLFSGLGPEKTKELFLWIAPNQSEEFPEGKQDDTHFREKGAYALSQLVVDEMKRLDLPVISHLKENNSHSH